MFHFIFLYCHMDECCYFHFTFILKVILKSIIMLQFLFIEPTQIFLGLCFDVSELVFILQDTLK